MKIRYTLKELGKLAVEQIGFCVGVHWTSVTGTRVPKGMISARCRLAYIFFSGFAPAYRFHELLIGQNVDCLPRRSICLASSAHEGRTITGVVVVAVLSPNSANPLGFQPAPAHHVQPGFHQYFRRQAAHANSARAWWDEGEREGGLDDETRFDDHTVLAPSTDYAARQVDEETERELDRLEAEYDAKLWWYGVPGRRSKYAPKLGSVQELFAYARRQELDPAEFARRNREKQAEQWLAAEQQRERSRQQELSADQAEIAAALHAPRPGSAHATDQDWHATEQLLRARKGLRVVYRDIAPRTRRRRSA